MINAYDYSIAHPEIFKQLAADDLRLLYYTCPQVESRMNCYSHYNEIAFTVNGQKCFHNRGKSWLLTENSGLFLKKTAYNQEKFWNHEWEVLAFYFPDEFIIRVFNEYKPLLQFTDLPDFPADMLLPLHINERTKDYFYSFIPWFSENGAPPSQLLTLKLGELIFLLLSDPANAHLISYLLKIVDQSKPPLNEVMEANFTYNLKVDEFARLSQRSVALFKKEFRAQYKTSPAKWLANKRFMHASVQLLSTDTDVETIAYETGYENVSHFCRVFQKKSGMSPHKYRKSFE